MLMASVLLLIPFEGIICLMMASPLAVGIGLVAGWSVMPCKRIYQERNRAETARLLCSFRAVAMWRIRMAQHLSSLRKRQ